MSDATLQSIILVVHIILGIAIIGLVLVQRGKGAQAGAAFGGGASSTVFGARGSASFLTRLTGILAACFFVTSLTYAALTSSAPGTVVKTERPTAPTNEGFTPGADDSSADENSIPAPSASIESTPAVKDDSSANEAAVEIQEQPAVEELVITPTEAPVVGAGVVNDTEAATNADSSEQVNEGQAAEVQASEEPATEEQVTEEQASEQQSGETAEASEPVGNKPAENEAVDAQ